MKRQIKMPGVKRETLDYALEVMINKGLVVRTHNGAGEQVYSLTEEGERLAGKLLEGLKAQ